MDDCIHCSFKQAAEGEACGDMWLKRRYGSFWIEAPVGESEVFYCPWCGRDLSEENENER